MKRFLLWGVISLAAHTAVFLAVSGKNPRARQAEPALEVGLVKLVPPAFAREKALKRPPAVAAPPAKSPPPPQDTDSTLSKPADMPPVPAPKKPPRKSAEDPKTVMRPANRVRFGPEIPPLPESPPPQDPSAAANAVRTEQTESKVGEFAVAPPQASAITPPPAPSEVREEAGHSIAPRYRKTPAPLYPLRARQRGWEGDVWLRALVGSNGRVAKLWVEQSSGHPILDQSALETVRDWLFHPGLVNSKPAAEEVRFPVRFTLAGS